MIFICECPQFWIHSILTEVQRGQTYSSQGQTKEQQDALPKVWLLDALILKSQTAGCLTGRGYQVF